MLLLTLAACGGRTSTLDPDALSVEANQPSDNSGGGSANGAPKPSPGTGAATSTPGSGNGAPAVGPTAGGAPGIGTAGSATAGSTPSGGSSTGGTGTAGAASGGSAGLDPQAITNCTNYCDVSARPRPCNSKIPSAECASSCIDELSHTSTSCQIVGADLLECLTKVYENSSNCADVDQLMFAKCSSLFSSYENCTGQTPPPPPEPSACESSGSVGPGKCNVDVQCSSTHYNVSCYRANANQLSCSCTSVLPDGSVTGHGFDLNENETFACEDGFAICGFPQLGLK